jgi:cytochrome d ubiquinol oxidase subunit II
MSLADVPLILLLVGLVAYTVLAGADFGAGMWQLGAAESDDRRQVSQHAYRAIAPVWEANHVWLIFVLVICWTAYPTAFGSIFSTLAIPLLAAAIGIIVRGTAYALHTVGLRNREEPAVRAIFAVSSLLTPFFLGASIGAIASGRVPVGNARGDPVSSWLAPTPILAGALALAVSAYLAAVYLAADAARIGRQDLVEAFRNRALAGGIAAGALAVGGLAVLHGDARSLYDALVFGDGLPALVLSVAAGVATLGLVSAHRFQSARYCAALAVAGIVLGWALAQQPTLLPGLTVHQAAAAHATLVAVLIAAAIGLVVLAPSLVLLFGLVLRGRFDEDVAADGSGGRAPTGVDDSSMRGAPCAALLAAGVVLTVLGNGLVLAIGVITMLATAVWTFTVLTGSRAAW